MKFETNLPEHSDSWKSFNALDAEHAAERAAEEHYQEGTVLPEAFRVVVRVRECGEEDFTEYRVSAEAEINFYAQFNRE